MKYLMVIILVMVLTAQTNLNTFEYKDVVKLMVIYYATGYLDGCKKKNLDDLVKDIHDIRKRINSQVLPEYRLDAEYVDMIFK